jgi:hypothetical protein
VQLTGGLSLLAVAKLIVDFLMTKNKDYADLKTETSDDFSDIRAARKKSKVAQNTERTATEMTDVHGDASDRA